MESLKRLIDELNAQNTFYASANDVSLQFETTTTGAMLFSTVLPERLVTENTFRDTGVRFKTVIANDNTRYSPPQYKKNMIAGSVLVEMADSDTAAQLSAQEYEIFIRQLDRGDTIQAIASLTRMFETGVAEPLAILRERHRVDAIAMGYIHRRGANGFQEYVHFPKPPGHRLSVPSGTTGTPAGWYSPTYSILSDLKTIKALLLAKGYRVNRVITTPEIVNNCLLINNEIKSYGLVTLQAPGGGSAVQLTTRQDRNSMVAALDAIGFPVPEEYDAGYSDQTKYNYFLNSKFIILCTTGRSAEVNLGENTPIIIPNSLGYTAIGLATNQLSPGVATKVEAFDGKDARIDAMGWQAAFPIIQDPEAYAVFTINKPV